MDNIILKKKTKIVMFITFITMIFEILFGILTNSMSLMADGFHMSTHLLAMFVTFITCNLVIKYKNKEEILNALGSYTSSLFLLFTSFFVFYESVEKLYNVRQISFNEAMIVTVIGLLVNIVCMIIMKDNHNTCNMCDSCNHHNHENMNFKALYIHIISDALTSIMAIVSLLFAKYFNFVFLDPIMGIIGAILIFKWSIKLLKNSFLVFIE